MTHINLVSGNAGQHVNMAAGKGLDSGRRACLQCGRQGRNVKMTSVESGGAPLDDEEEKKRKEAEAAAAAAADAGSATPADPEASAPVAAGDVSAEIGADPVAKPVQAAADTAAAVPAAVDKTIEKVAAEDSAASASTDGSVAPESAAGPVEDANPVDAGAVPEVSEPEGGSDCAPREVVPECGGDTRMTIELDGGAFNPASEALSCGKDNKDSEK